MKPNKDKKGNITNVCMKCIHVNIEAGTPPCVPIVCEVSAILSGTFQYLEKLKDLEKLKEAI